MMDYRTRLVKAEKQIGGYRVMDCEIAHDDWCDHIPCSCTPDITLEDMRTLERWSVGTEGTVDVLPKAIDAARGGDERDDS
jgi:hypothetical protein